MAGYEEANLVVKAPVAPPQMPAKMPAASTGLRVAVDTAVPPKGASVGEAMQGEPESPESGKPGYIPPPQETNVGQKPA